MHHSGLRIYFDMVPNGEVSYDAYLAPNHTVFTYGRRARNARLCCHDGVCADANIVSDHTEVINFCAFFNNSFAEGSAVHVVLAPMLTLFSMRTMPNCGIR